MDTYLSLDNFLNKIKKNLPFLKEKFHIETLEVFGSFLRGEEKEGSDLDLLVTFSEVPSLFGYIRLENHLSDLLGVKVDLVMKDSLKPSIGERILAEAQPISGLKNNFQEVMGYVLEKNTELYRRLAA